MSIIFVNVWLPSCQCSAGYFIIHLPLVWTLGLHFNTIYLHSIVCYCSFTRTNSIPPNRADKSDRIQKRQLGVYFKNLHVTGLGSSVSYQPTVGSIFDPRAQMDAIDEVRHPRIRDILQGFEGVVRPGEMLREYQFFRFCNLCRL